MQAVSSPGKSHSQPAPKQKRSIDAALKEAYRIYGSDKFTRLATKRFLH